MKTLVIHPDDRSTDFLKLVYEGKDYDIINFNNNELIDYEMNEIRSILYDEIEKHDRILMMGHGTPYGLLNPKRGGFIIDDSFANLLRTKDTVSIWCYSDQFFKRNNIYNNQFHTGMIISETLEQLYVLGRVYLNKDQQLINMNIFAKAVGECIEDTPENMRIHVLENYKGDDPITEFNRRNILVF